MLEATPLHVIEFRLKRESENASAHRGRSTVTLETISKMDPTSNSSRDSIFFLKRIKLRSVINIVIKKKEKERGRSD